MSAATGATGVTGATGAAPVPSYAVAYQLGTLSNSALGGALRLTGLTASSYADYFLDESLLTIVQPGTYLLRCTVFAPANTATSTTISLQAGSNTAPLLALPVQSAASASSRSYTAETIFTTAAAARLRLASSAVISWNGTAATPMAILFAQRLR